MASLGTDWLAAAAVLQKHAPTTLLVVPPRRRTMIEALLKQADTFARLSCCLAARSHESDSKQEYEQVEDDFIDAMQDFQRTLQKVLGWRDIDAVKVEPESQELGLVEEDMGGELGGWGMGSEQSGDDEVEMESMGSQRSVIRDPMGDMYVHMTTSLLEDLQEPLVEQLQEPLLQELADPLGTRVVSEILASPQHLDTLATALLDHPTLLQALADKMQPQLTGSLVVPMAHHVRDYYATSGVPCTPEAAQPRFTSPHPMPTASRVPIKRETSLPSVSGMKIARRGVTK